MGPIKKVIGGICLICSTCLLAHDHLNLERGIPLEVEDAFVTPYMNREFQAYLRYDEVEQDKEKYVLVPKLEMGLIKNFQFELSAPFEFGDRINKQTSNIEIEGLYNFNRESLVVPAIALGGGVFLPTGEGLKGQDTVARLNITKTLPIPMFFHRTHFNVQWIQNAEPRKTERNNLMKYVMGYQFRISTDDMIIADYVYEEEYREKMEVKMIELGWRHQYNPLTVLAPGVGFGLDDESPDVRVMISFQRSLNFPY